MRKAGGFGLTALLAAISCSFGCSPTPSPSPTPSIGACDAGTLKVRLLSETGAAGSFLPTYVFFDTGSVTCYLQGQPGLTLRDAGGHVLFSQPETPDPTAPRIALTPGVTDPGTTTAPHGTATADYRIANWCLIGTLQSVAIELTTGGSVPASGNLQLPGCNSTLGTPPTIESHAFAAAP